MMELHEIHPRSFLATATREQLQQRILDDAEQHKRQDERARTLVEERDRALDDREAALDLAEQYARKAGVDVDRDELLGGIAAWWKQRARAGRALDELEAQRWDVQRFATSLEEWARDGRLEHLSGPKVSAQVGRRLGELFSAQGRASGRGKDLFARPAAPGLID